MKMKAARQILSIINDPRWSVWWPRKFEEDQGGLNDEDVAWCDEQDTLCDVWINEASARDLLEVIDATQGSKRELFVEMIRYYPMVQDDRQDVAWDIMQEENFHSEFFVEVLERIGWKKLEPFVRTAFRQALRKVVVPYSR